MGDLIALLLVSACFSKLISLIHIALHCSSGVAEAWESIPGDRDAAVGQHGREPKLNSD